MSAKLHIVKKSRKDYPDADIKKGDKYYWWKFQRCEKHRSKVFPSRSQLTRSEFWSSVYIIQENIEEIVTDDYTNRVAELRDDIEQIAIEIEVLRDKTQDKVNNIPESLKDANTANMLRKRVEALENWQGEIEILDTNIDSDLSEPEQEEALDGFMDELQLHYIDVDCE